ncbi:MAG: hypothetical protein OM95_09560 [Bdellovibrio sp. ArHS]|uniref:DUF4423 domain-containing protein n=1 Tax=Bdellovibrio sp. ArHS TaxID=1569284 RepID=UPI000582FB97|nr:DUF4423 domain-containing protein [Bdellovibrio sp. ArHS]KHD88372.1 MAG: hypothetical protein OM95_09560 [Bdellovibrio sp. ArHS]
MPVLHAQKRLVEQLIADFKSRNNKNPKFSLRAYARTLGVSPTSLSQIMSGKRKLTYPVAVVIFDKVAMDPKDRDQALSVLRTHMQDERRRKTKYDVIEVEAPVSKVSLSWLEMAITPFMSTPHYNGGAESIARYFGVSKQEASNALKHLEQMQIVEWKDGGYREVFKAELRYGSERMPTEVVKKLRLESLERTRELVSRNPPEDQGFMGVSYMAVSEQHKTKALNELQSFVKNFRKKYGTIGEADEIFLLSVNFLSFAQQGK